MKVSRKFLNSWLNDAPQSVWLNKKGLVFNEIIWIIKIILFFVIIGAILYFGAQASGFNLGDWFAKGLAGWNVQSANVTAGVV